MIYTSLFDRLFVGAPEALGGFAACYGPFAGSRPGVERLSLLHLGGQ